MGDGPYRTGWPSCEWKTCRTRSSSPWVAHTSARQVRKADVGVIPHPKNDHTDTTIPNKLFDYMAAAGRFLVSNAAPLERIVLAANVVGLVFRRAIAEPGGVLARMSADRAALESMGRNGAAAVRQRFHWERDAGVLQEAVARFA